MRQAGIIAAAGLAVLDNINNQILEDHKNANFLVDGNESIKGLKVDASKVKTTIIYCRLDTDSITSERFLKACKEKGILFFQYPSGDYRLVTHCGVDADDIKLVLLTFEKILS